MSERTKKIPTYITFFRGINVGGNYILPMKELVGVLESLGLINVRTYIQSGNAIFQSKVSDTSQLAAKISAAIRKSHGFAPHVFLLEVAALRDIIKANPFPEAEAQGNTLHFNFLDDVPSAPDMAGIEKLSATSECYELKGNVFYMFAPDGIGRSKLMVKLERLLGVPITSRNWNTVRKLMEMAEDNAA